MEIVNYHHVILLLLVVLLVLVDDVLSIKIVQYSDTRLVKKGENVVLFCKSDVKYDLCSWNISGNLCKGSVGQGVSVKCSDRILLKPGTEQCELTIENVGESDEAKTYSCGLTLMGQEAPEFVKQGVKFEVARVAAIDSSLRQEEEMIKILEGDSFSFTCSSLGGKPEGTVRGYLGDLMLEETFEEFQFTASRGDCGKQVMCDMRQLDEKGGLFFPTVQNITRKIMVVFAPKFNEKYTKEYGYNEETGEPVRIQVRLESHPAPKASQVLWRIGNTTIQPDQGLGEKFYAHPVEKQDGDWVVLGLDVTNMEKADQDLQYSLEVRNDYSLGPLIFPFRLHFNAKAITTTTTTTVEPYVFSTVPMIEAENMGGGSIAAIVVILIAILISLICVAWLKKNQRLCFKPYEEVSQKPDQTDGKEKSIIKEKADSKQQDSNKPKAEV